MTTPSAGNDGTPRVLSILVVDDDPETSLAIAEMLAHIGHSAGHCVSGIEALEQLQVARFDLIIVDYRMPELTGLDLIALFRKHDCALPVIMMTGYAATEDRVLSEELGVVALLRKPITPEQLSRAIDECMGFTRPAPGGSA